MTRPLLLDLFCGAGDCSVGYHRAGFDIIGVDLNRPALREYPYPCVRADALDALATWNLSGVDVIHASPPCQAYSITRHSHGREHPDLLPRTRELLQAWGGPYVIENVPGAPLHNPITLCGAAFNLTATDTDGTPLVLKRHRLFESNVWLWPTECDHLTYTDRGHGIGGVYGGGSQDKHDAKHRRHGGYTPNPSVMAQLMGIDWMRIDRLTQAIPPAFTEFIGEQLHDHLTREATP